MVRMSEQRELIARAMRELRFANPGSDDPLGFLAKLPADISGHGSDLLYRFLQTLGTDAQRIAPVSKLIVFIYIDAIAIRLSNLFGIVCHGFLLRFQINPLPQTMVAAAIARRRFPTST
jgi:hypothetical protein